MARRFCLLPILDSSLPVAFSTICLILCEGKYYVCCIMCQGISEPFGLILTAISSFICKYWGGTCTLRTKNSCMGHKHTRLCFQHFRRLGLLVLLENEDTVSGRLWPILFPYLKSWNAFCNSSKVLLFPEMQQLLENHLGRLILCCLSC